MRSSNGFGGGATGAWPRVQVCPTARAESGTIVTAQQKVARGREGQLLTNHRRDVDTRGPGWQRIDLGIVGSRGIGREERTGHVNVHFLEHLGQAPATFPADDRVQGTPPEEFSLAGGLELAGDRNFADEVEPQVLQGGIVRTKLSIRPHGTALQVPNIHSQHSPLR